MLDVFDEAEDLEDAESLERFYAIGVQLFLLNDSSLFDVFVADDFFEKVVGCFECELGTRLPGGAQ